MGIGRRAPFRSERGTAAARRGYHYSLEELTMVVCIIAVRSEIPPAIILASLRAPLLRTRIADLPDGEHRITEDYRRGGGGSILERSVTNW